MTEIVSIFECTSTQVHGKVADFTIVVIGGCKVLSDVSPEFRSQIVVDIVIDI